MASLWDDEGADGADVIDVQSECHSIRWDQLLQREEESIKG